MRAAPLCGCLRRVRICWRSARNLSPLPGLQVLLALSFELAERPRHYPPRAEAGVVSKPRGLALLLRAGSERVCPSP
jgi:hypothetical protein